MMPQRPDHFRLNMSHPLANGLVFAGLGAHAGSTRYHDSSVFGNTGTLTNMDPATDWVWNTTLNRIGIDLDGSNDKVVTSFIPSAVAHTVSFWFIPAVLDTYRILFSSGANSFEFFTRNTAKFDYYGNKTVTSAESLAAWNLYHIALVDTTASVTPWINGVALSASTTANTPTPAALQIGSRPTNTFPSSSRLFDFLWHQRPLSDSEVRQLADPSNVMLSGLILPPRRKWWPVVAGTPATFKAAWLARQNNVIGGGTL